MTIRAVALAAILAVIAFPSAAQDIEGRWNVSMSSDFGPVSFAFLFDRDEAGKLVGTMQNDFGSTPITAGVIDGNKISFNLALDFGQGPQTFVYEGTVEGDEIRMVSSFEEPPPGIGPVEQPFTATRAK